MARKPKAIQLVECNNGMYFRAVARNGHLTYEAFDKDKMVAMDEKGPFPCNCPVCLARAANAVTLKERGELRSGKRRGAYEYGEGHVLGGK